MKRLRRHEDGSPRMVAQVYETLADILDQQDVTYITVDNLRQMATLLKEV